MLSIDDVPFPGPSEWVTGLVEGHRGTLVQEKRNRSVWRVEEHGRVWFAKRGGRSKAREVAREARWLERLLAADVAVSQLLAAGPYAGGFWVVTAPAPGSALSESLAAALLADDQRRIRGLLGAAAVVTRALHEAGFRFPDLSASHVFVEESEVTEETGERGECGECDPPTATLIDVARVAAPLGGVGLRARAEDLAALLFSLPFGVERGARARFLRDATGWGGDDLRSVTRRLDAAVRHLASRTRWRHEYAGASKGVRDALTALRGDAADGSPAPSLFTTLLDPTATEIVRTLSDRENRRFDGPDGTRYFMKTYPPVGGGFSPAMHELRGIDRLSRAGIPVCRAEAYGEDVDEGSFVVVRGCPGEPLDDLLRRGVTLAERRELARATAEILARMRRARLRHRDAYPCHFFVDRLSPASDGTPRFDVRVIDLTRAGRAPHPRERWYVKDASQLWHGIPRDAITRTDAVRWLRTYFGIPRLDFTAKRFARRVIVKEARIRRRQDRKARARSE